MEDIDDGDGDADADGDGDGNDDGDGDGDGDDPDNDDDEGDNEDEDEEQEDTFESPTRTQRPSRPIMTAQVPLQNGIPANQDPADGNAIVRLHSTSPHRPHTPSNGALPIRPQVRPECLNASIYDIVPTIAAPHSTSINSITATPDMRWVFSGGADGYIRKFNWVDTANGKLMLTVAQRHPFVDSVTKAGVLLSYWENEETSDRTPPYSNDDSISLSPVYSLAVHHQGLWLLSGTESGSINLQSVRHQEGHRITSLRKHTSAVSVLSLAQDEKSVLSGSWDKTINDWDLNSGQIKRRFETAGGQISAIEPRPLSTLPVPEESGLPLMTNGTFSSNNADKPLANGTMPNGISAADASNANQDDNGNEDAPGAEVDSLFGDNESLFDGNGDTAADPSGQGFGDEEEDEISRAINNEMRQAEERDAESDVDMMDEGGPVQPHDPPNDTNNTPTPKPEPQLEDQNVPPTVPKIEDPSQPSTLTSTNLPHSEESANLAGSSNGLSTSYEDLPPSSDTTFLDASIDGTLRVWDRRQQNPIARIMPPRGIPPWCMNACWSPDGNFIYAGRRNGSVDEYSLHHGLRQPRRTFKFPGVSGPVSALRAMPNGKHLVCASFDILRLYDLKDGLDDSGASTTKHSAVPYLIVPGHRTGVISQLYLDPTCTFMISTGGNRGWEGSSTEVLLGYEIGILR
ncbi:WD40 repeat-like protein [Saccharata proteae CBS 121410]|uniref:WD40 repeat-like protein n=1 Tax=Saccharata proteae CBS 121410 TaxID=1314787 RepID=A0A9P4HTA7_9PEZI|nr:WD40 repeat-like protein [Saccharata proteae CBS 121410]